MADIFGTTVTTPTLVIQFLEACAAFSSEASSLKEQFEWDLRALKQTQECLNSIANGRANGFQDLGPEDLAPVKTTADYLNSLVGKVNKNLDRIQQKGWKYTNIVNITWVQRRSELQDMQKEIHEWTERLNVRVLSLPGKIRTAVHATHDTQHSAVIRSGNKLQEFFALSSNDKLSRSKEILLEPPEELILKIRDTEDFPSPPVRFGGQQIVVAYYKALPDNSRGMISLETLTSEMAERAAALNCLDPAMDVRLLKVDSYFYRSATKRFLFLHTLPYETHTIMTIRELIQQDSFPEVKTALNKRLKIAYQLAEAVFFLHTAGLCHKNITSHSVVILRRLDTHKSSGDAPSRIDEAYLMGYSLIRGTDAITREEVDGQRTWRILRRNFMDFGIFQHPDRFEENSSRRYNTQHDMYSLGVVLLLIGLWQPLLPEMGYEAARGRLNWRGKLIQIAGNIHPRVGERYQRVVLWCLGLSGDRIVKNAEFMQEVLDPLEDMMNALA